MKKQSHRIPPRPHPKPRPRNKGQDSPEVLKQDIEEGSITKNEFGLRLLNIMFGEQDAVKVISVAKAIEQKDIPDAAKRQEFREFMGEFETGRAKRKSNGK